MFSLFFKKNPKPVYRSSRLLQDLDKVTQSSSVYLVLVQDFMSLSNHGGFFRAIKIFEDPAEGLKYLYSQGQREAGLVVEVVASNNLRVAALDEPDKQFPQVYEAFQDNWIVCRHQPTEFVTDRFGICKIIGGNDPDGLPLAVWSMMEEPVFSFVARIYVIADAEHGQYSGIRKICGRANIAGVE